MNSKIVASLFAACLLASAPSFAEMNEVDKQYVDQLIKGGPGTLRQAAENMVNTGYSNTEVLDVVAEVILEKYPQAGNQFTYVDSVAWLCRAPESSVTSRQPPRSSGTRSSPVVAKSIRSA